MASTKEMQRRAKLAREKQKFEKRWKDQDHTGPAGFSCGTNQIPVKNGLIAFEAMAECAKAMDLVQRDPAPGKTRSNLKDVAAMQFGPYEAGFFIAVLPCQDQGNGRAGFYVDPDRQDQAQHVFEHFKARQITPNLVMISAYASWDRAQQHYWDIVDTFGYAVIVFSSPRNLQILAEDPEFYKNFDAHIVAKKQHQI